MGSPQTEVPNAGGVGYMQVQYLKIGDFWHESLKT